MCRRITVTTESLEQGCDRLSQVVDVVQFERLRWARDEGPKIARIVELTQAAVASRSDYDLAEEGSGGNIKRFVVKIHGFRIVAVAVGLQDGRAVMRAEPIERSKYRLASSDPILADYAMVDEAWIAQGLETLFARVQG
jgi:hypothetical protein